MSMSRKHFKALAGMVREFHDYDDVRELAPDWWARKLADFCGSDSGLFNRVRFLEACKPGCFYTAEPAEHLIERAQAAEDSVTVADVAGPAGSWWAPTYEAVRIDGEWRVNEYWPGSTLVRRYAPFWYGDSCRGSAQRALEMLSEGDNPFSWNVGETSDWNGTYWALPPDSERFVLASMPEVGGRVVFGVLDRDTGCLCHWGCDRPGMDSDCDRGCLRALTSSRELGSPSGDYFWESASRFGGPVIVHDDRVLRGAECR